MSCDFDMCFINENAEEKFVSDRSSHSNGLQMSDTPFSSDDRDYFGKLRSAAATGRQRRSRKSISLRSPVERGSARAQLDLLLKQLHAFRIRTVEAERQIVRWDPCSSAFDTAHGRVIVDFTRQAVNEELYFRLLQLVPISGLDHVIEKIFHRSGQLRSLTLE